MGDTLFCECSVTFNKEVISYISVFTAKKIFVPPVILTHRAQPQHLRHTQVLQSLFAAQSMQFFF